MLMLLAGKERTGDMSLQPTTRERSMPDDRENKTMLPLDGRETDCVNK
uniref:Uncharacterized protein n=1 Tax=Picea glauca TaxID=3330 RepID=A0A101M2T1_PICGL|nr:hypothetical protein ABT39_MTgene3081 [Picea glauca]QHR87304.1 hypothetical protein Q903MT_gene1314 [Picea sitchensis]